MLLSSASGRVVADSDKPDPSAMEDHSDRPEVRAALREGWGEATPVSPTLCFNSRHRTCWTSMWISIRSGSGPLIFEMYR